MKTKYIALFLTALLIHCSENPTVTGGDEGFTVYIHLNTQNSNAPILRIEGQMNIQRAENISVTFTIFEDSALATIKNLYPDIWNLSVNFYNEEDSLIGNGSIDIDVLAEMDPHIFIDYYPDHAWNDLMLEPQEMEDIITSLVFDSVNSWFNWFPGYDTGRFYVPDSTQFDNNLNDLGTEIFSVIPDLKLTTLLDYYLRNYEPQPILLTNAERPHAVADIPDPRWWNLDFDRFYAEHPDALGIILFSRPGFSPSYNQVVIFVTTVFRPLEADGFVVYIKKRKNFKIVKIEQLFVT